VPAAPLPAAEEQPERDQRAEEYPEHQPDEPAQEHGSGQQRDPAAPEDTAPVLDTEEYLGTEEYGDAAEHPETDEYHEQAPAMPEAGSALAYWFGKTHPATDPPWDGAADPQPATPAPLPHFDRLHSTPSRPHD
jgi:hypothetical protein